MTEVIVEEDRPEINYIEEILNTPKVKIYRIKFLHGRPHYFTDEVINNERTIWISSDFKPDEVISKITFRFPGAHYHQWFCHILGWRMIIVFYEDDIDDPKRIYSRDK